MDSEERYNGISCLAFHRCAIYRPTFRRLEETCFLVYCYCCSCLHYSLSYTLLVDCARCENPPFFLL